MKQNLKEEIKRIKSLFTEERLYGNIIKEQDDYMSIDNDGNVSVNPNSTIIKNLPGPNYYEIQKFLEKVTGIDTGSPGFGDKTAEALGVYLFGNKNTIKTVEELSKILTNLGFDTEGKDFGINYATAVSEIIKFMENGLSDLGILIDKSENKGLIKNIVNTSINTFLLPIEDTIPLSEILPSTPPGKMKGNGAATRHYNSFRNKDMDYDINTITLKDYDINTGIIDGTISGTIYIDNVYGGNDINTTFYGEITLKLDIVDGRYLHTKIESVNVSTGYQYIDEIVDVGFQIKNNKLRYLFAINLNPFWPGHTEFGPYYEKTPIEKEVKKTKIDVIDLKKYEQQFKDQILKKIS